VDQFTAPTIFEEVNELPRSKMRGISLAEFIDLIEASFEELNPQRLKKKR